MKLRTQFIISTLVFGAILLIIAASLMITNQRVEQTNKQERIARNLQQQANELSYLSSAYLLYRESQQLSRWESRYDSFSNELTRLELGTAEQRVLVDSIKRNQERLKAVFTEVRASLESPSQTQGRVSDPAFIQVSWSRMEVQNQGMIFDASRLAQMLRDQTDQLKQMNTLLMFALTAVFGAFLVANYVLTYRRTLRSISTLRHGTRIIGSGNLNHRLGMTARDELGELAQSFDRMTEQLQLVTVSKKELQQEVEERKQAEAEREQLLAQLREANEQLVATSIRNQELAAEAQRRAAELDAIIESMADPVIIFDAGGTLVRANSAAIASFGFDPVGMDRQGLALRLSMRRPSGPPVVVDEMPSSRALRGETVVGERLEFTDGEGRSVTVLIASAPFVMNGGVLGTVAIWHDVTERERLLAEAQRRAGELDAVFTAMTDAVIVYDASGVPLKANPAATAAYGFDPLAADRETMSRDRSIRHPDGTPVAVDELPSSRALRGEIIMGERFIFASPEGQDLIILASASPLFVDGKVSGAVVVRHDITERERLLAEVQRRADEREEHLASLDTLIRVSEEMLAQTTAEGMLKRVVDAARDLTDARIGTSGHGYQEGSFVVIATSRAEDRSPCLPGEVFAVQNGGVYLDLIHSQNSIRLTDQELRRHPAWWGLPEGHAPLRGLLGARLIGADGQADGLIMVSDKEEGDFTEEDEALLVQLAALASLGLEHIEARTEAQRRAAELDAVIENMAEGVTIVSGEGRVLRINAAGRDMWGLTSYNRVIGAAAKDLQPNILYPDGRPWPKDQWPMGRVLRGETFAQQEVIYVRPDGSKKHLLFSGSAVHDDQGNAVLGVTVYRDITELREMERQREEFISVVAHDLRGELTVVKGYADLLTRRAAKDALPEQIRQGLEAISASSKILDRITADLTDASRIEACRLTLDTERIDLPVFVRSTAQRLQELTKGHPVRVEVHGQVPIVEADPDRIEQVLSNLLSNAGKYSYPDTEIRVDVEPGPAEVVLSITNLGPGIAPEDKEKLFDRFHRTSQAKQEKVPGLGLGLYIAKGLVEAHEGRIWVESEPGEYTTFCFTLPLT